MHRRHPQRAVLRLLLAAVLAVGLVPVAHSTPAAGSACIDGDLMCGIVPVPETALDASACGQAAVAMFLEAYGTVPGATAHEKLEAVARYVPRHPTVINRQTVLLTGREDVQGVLVAAAVFGIPMTSATWTSVRAPSWLDDLRAIVVTQRKPVMVFLPNLQPIWTTMNPIGHFVVVSGITAADEIIEHDAWDGLPHLVQKDIFEQAWAARTTYGAPFQYLDVQGAGPLVADHVPGGVWVSPGDNMSLAGLINVVVRAYPSRPGDPPIAMVAVTVSWPVPGKQSGPWRTVCTLEKPASGDQYGCTVDPGAVGAPPGSLLLSFDVTDSGGATNFAPNGIRTLNWMARTASPTSTPKPTPRPTQSPVGEILLPQNVWRAVGDVSIGDPSTDGSFTVATTGTFWAGITTAPATLGCDYSFTGEAKIVSGDGYGFVVRAMFQDTTPSGHGIQYDVGAGGYRDVEYPDESETGRVIATQLDTAWHRIAVTVRGAEYTETVDGRQVFAGTTATTCGGLYIRLWRTTAILRNLNVTSSP